ncbi:hypothetical protein GCM10007978_31530 [Shewanella hanedai]|uniref:Periplasmic protein n=1 Tax=Shewanella hanedai TaxID=25 RepID=A0A553JUF5_SHEHA|nr:hypothetical protein [Shewanella hanedai]TRY16074.1 hypothetical protein FN961_00100 [Shewanella hanedai]GGI91610.1 hypothetical protein GCM10007978_31530 [Shewanella hanedai]
MRKLWITAAAMLISANATAGITQELSACASITDELNRLTCFDALAQTVKTQAPITPAVVATATVAAKPVSANVEEEFGNLRKAKADAIDKIYLEIASITKDPYGALKITFTNGQIWKQTDGRRYKLKVDQTVFIEKAALGSFVLGSDDRNTTIRVKRLK